MTPAPNVEPRAAGRRPPIAGLYAITPQTADDDWLCARAEHAFEGGARVLQYRDKDGTADSRRRRGRRLAALCARYQAVYIVNDDIALARELNAAGVHVGRDDAGVRTARASLGRDAIVGASCYDDLQRAERAVADGADYLAFGSFFASSVKPGAPRPALDVLREARARWDLPVVAIGGMTLGNAPAVLAAGADAIAVITALFEAPDTRAAAQAFCALFERRAKLSTVDANA